MKERSLEEEEYQEDKRKEKWTLSFNKGSHAERSKVVQPNHNKWWKRHPIVKEVDNDVV